MALTLTQVERRTVFGDRRVHIYDVTWDSAYLDEGEVLTPAMVDLSRIDFVDAGPVFDMTSDTAYLAAYDYDNEKMVLFNSAGDGDAFDEAGADDVSAFSQRILVVGV